MQRLNGVKPVAPYSCLIQSRDSRLKPQPHGSMSNGSQRARLLVAAITAFVGGLIVASGMNWTKLGFAQSRPSAAQIQPIAEASNAFVALANNVTPAVVSIEVFSAARPIAGTQRGRSTTPQAPPGMEDFFRQFDLPQQPRAM